jgi:hypothetical protein
MKVCNQKQASLDKWNDNVHEREYFVQLLIEFNHLFRRILLFEQEGCVPGQTIVLVREQPSRIVKGRVAQKAEY